MGCRTIIRCAVVILGGFIMAAINAFILVEAGQI